MGDVSQSMNNHSDTRLDEKDSERWIVPSTYLDIQHTDLI